MKKTLQEVQAMFLICTRKRQSAFISFEIHNYGPIEFSLVNSFGMLFGHITLT